MGHATFFPKFYCRSYHGRIFAPRRSIPSVNIASASALSRSFLSPSAFGHENVSLSSRLLISQSPVPSKYRIFKRVRLRFPNTKTAPLRTSSPKTSPAIADNPSYPLRMSHGSTATNTRRLPEKLSTAPSPPVTGSPPPPAPPASN